jgi:hypothetical protein
MEEVEGLIVEKQMRIKGCISLEGVFMELADSLYTLCVTLSGLS